MKTITPFELQMLIDKRHVELIDVRPGNEFKTAHALVARSIPLSEFEPHSVLSHRKLDKGAPLYIMCRKRVLASLAACGLAAAGLTEPIVVDGGIEAWERQCLPVVRRQSWRMPVIDGPAALLAGFVVGLGLVVHEFFFLVALFVFAAWAAPHAFRFAHDRYRDVDDNRWHGARVAECH
jgi:rhodanese-related sulfurtransferase